MAARFAAIFGRDFPEKSARKSRANTQYLLYNISVGIVKGFGDVSRKIPWGIFRGALFIWNCVLPVALVFL